MEKTYIVRDFRTLNALARAGFIELRGGPHATERHWTGGRVRVTTVREGDRLERWYQPFEHRGKKYRIEYFDGCFFPFVVRVDPQVVRPAFV